MNSYHNFIASKQRKSLAIGFAYIPERIPTAAFDWQRAVIRWSVSRGRAALFEECGLGKTLQQLAWADQVAHKTQRPVILHCPVGVRQQTIQEAVKFGIQTRMIMCDSDADVPSGPAICVTNYEKLHKLDTGKFTGVVLDESSILKSFTGATKRNLIAAYRDTPYRLACTATPAPNDYMELGNHAEFLGVMPSNEMLSRWFINDTMKAGGYRLKGHAAEDFWLWMSSWAMCLTKPSDLGDQYVDDGYTLPPLNRHDVIVDVADEPSSQAGTLFNNHNLNATTIHSVKRASTQARAEKVAQLIASDTGNSPWIVWCDTNYEADALVACISAVDASVVEVRGSQSESSKEQSLAKFSRGDARVIVTKPDIAGFGMNWQHCCNVAFVGLSYSFEKFYQAVRRSWRFGQTHPVNVYVVSTDIEYSINATVNSKEQEHQAMFSSMADAMRCHQQNIVSGDMVREKYIPQERMEIPAWMAS